MPDTSSEIREKGLEIRAFLSRQNITWYKMQWQRAG